MAQIKEMKLSRSSVPFVGAIALLCWIILQVTGNISTAVSMLDWLSPKSKAVVTSGLTWQFLTVGMLFWIALESHREARTITRAIRDAKANNERAWNFEPEFRQSIEEFELFKAEFQISKKALENRRSEVTQSIKDSNEQLGIALTSMRREIEAARNYWGQEFGESRAMERQRFDSTFRPFESSVFAEIEKIRARFGALETDLSSRLSLLERPIPKV